MKVSEGGCPLCGDTPPRPFAAAHGRRYLACSACGLIHLDPAQRPGPQAERAHYATHENDPSDPGYRDFLTRLADPLAARLPVGAEGLDYGSGPGPTLSLMLAERSFPMTIYDPFFAPDPAALTRTYDFITCSETAEHFFHPAREFQRLDRLLRPGGWLGVMTGIVPEDRAFAEWWYLRDPTHVSFYRPATMEWISRRFGWTPPSFPRNDVVLFRKPAPHRGTSPPD